MRGGRGRGGRKKEQRKDEEGEKEAFVSSPFFGVSAESEYDVQRQREGGREGKRGRGRKEEDE